MINYLKVDDKHRRLVMDRTFDKNRRIVGSDEYNLLQIAKANNPGYTLVLKRIKKNPNKKVYKHLTYDYMYEYVEKHPNAEARKAELDEMILRAQCHFDGYGNVKRWFLKAYPDISDFTPEQFNEEQVLKNSSVDIFEVVEDSNAESTPLPLAS